MLNTISIHTVIPTHGRCELLQRTLESLASADKPAGFERVWVIENGPQSGALDTYERMRNHLPLAYRHLPQPGRSPALQHAIEAIGQGLIIFLDDDVRVNQGFFNAYVDAALQHGDTCFFGGPLLIDYEKPPYDWLLDHLPASAKGWRPSDPKNPIDDQHHFLGANFAVFAQRVQKIGGFNPALGTGTAGDPVGEEVDLQDRLIRDDCSPIYVPNAQVWHYVPPNRCSPAWALRRLERIWLTSQLQRPIPSHDGPLWWDVPRWMWRRLAVLRLKAWIANLIWDPRKRFEAQKVFYQWRGTIRGMQISRERNGSISSVGAK